MKMNAQHEIKNQNDIYFTTGFVMGKFMLGKIFPLGPPFQFKLTECLVNIFDNHKFLKPHVYFE